MFLAASGLCYLCELRTNIYYIVRQLFAYGGAISDDSNRVPVFRGIPQITEKITLAMRPVDHYTQVHRRDISFQMS